MEILKIHSHILQIEIFQGDENMLTMNQTHDKKFHCIYLLHYYPFDTQICRVDLQLEKFSQVAILNFD